MYVSLKNRAAALVASIFATFTMVYTIADYALPKNQVMALAQTSRCGPPGPAGSPVHALAAADAATRTVLTGGRCLHG